MTQNQSTSVSPATLLGLFALGTVASFTAAIFMTGQVLGAMPTEGPMPGLALTSVVLCAALLVLSRVLLHREGATLRELGLVPNRTRLQEFGFGFIVTTSLFLFVAFVQSTSVGAVWEFQGMPGVRAALVGLALSTVLALAEELLFRGVALRYLRALYGDWSAVLLSALLFGGYHLVQSDDWAMGAVFRFLMPAFGGLFFGWAALRSKGLALPLGLHLGGNWVQASLASFAPGAVASAAVPAASLWRIPITTADARTLTAPDLLPHLPYVVALALAAMATWKWFMGSGSRHRTT